MITATHSSESSTPKKQKVDSPSSTPKRTYKSHNHHVERAMASQDEMRDSLKKIVEQNDLILSELKKISTTLERE